MNIYEWADRAINSCPRYETGFTELLAAKPYRVSSAVRRQYDSRLLLIRSFQKTAVDLFRAALNNDVHPTILHWLINETPQSLGLEYHRRLEDRHYSLPVFFRTDETQPGKIVEVQCPGSLWGELQLTFECLKEMGYRIEDLSPAAQFTTQLTDFLKEPAIVHHLIDNASAPAGMRYFIEKTRPGIKYWGIDRDIKVGQCNFIRSHSVFSLWAENEFLLRMSKVGSGVTYDLPPHILFDMKAMLALPFWSLTRQAFSDDIREIFLFTTPLLPSGVELPDGGCLSIEEFSRLPRSQRDYYLKYAGADISLNWGSKAVYRLSNMSSDACLDFLRQCLSGYEKGRIWLLQKEDAQDDQITYLDRDGAPHTDRLRAKFSGFYGPAGCIGVIAQHRRHNKVHGQADTVVSYVLADEGDPNAA